MRRFHLLYQGGVRLARTMVLEEALDLLELDLHLSVATRARQRLFVHAGVVGWKGQAILVPGYSFSGKSTLVAALVRAGARYYSDEYAVLDASGRVHAFPKPLILRSPDGRQYFRRVLRGDRGAGGPPLPVGLVVAVRYRPGGRWRPQRVSPGQGLLLVLSHTIPARSRPREAVRVLCRALGRAVVIQSTRGEADETARILLGWLSRRQSVPRDAER
jgi:hypothetical protein